VSLWSALSAAYTAARESEAAVAAARTELDADRGPVKALRALAAVTSTPVDDAAVAELEAFLRRTLTLFALASEAFSWVAMRLQDPAVRKDLDAAIDWLIAAGLDAAAWRARIASWLED
jgi:hypothetical protein